MDDQNTTGRSDDSSYSSSSRGPTGDGRRKPEIVAPGTNIISANNDWEGPSPDFISRTGTSMAAPQVAASILLLMDYMGNVFSPIYKALLMNAADDWGNPGPDNTYGWGYLNLWEAYFNRDFVYDDYVDDNAPDYKFYEGSIVAGEKATLAWNRHALYAGPDFPTTYYDSNDLDLYISTKPTTFKWILLNQRSTMSNR